MTQPAAKKGDRVVGVDTHIVMISSPGGPVPTPIPMAFSGRISSEVSETVFIDEEPAAYEGSVADNSPRHIPSGGPFQKRPADKGTIARGSSTVFADDKGLARNTDPVECCNDPRDSQTGLVIASGTVISG